MTVSTNRIAVERNVEEGMILRIHTSNHLAGLEEGYVTVTQVLEPYYTVAEGSDPDLVTLVEEYTEMAASGLEGSDKAEVLSSLETTSWVAYQYKDGTNQVLPAQEFVQHTTQY